MEKRVRKFVLAKYKRNVFYNTAFSRKEIYVIRRYRNFGQPVRIVILRAVNYMDKFLKASTLMIKSKYSSA